MKFKRTKFGEYERAYQQACLSTLAFDRLMIKLSDRESKLIEAIRALKFIQKKASVERIHAHIADVLTLIDYD